MKSTVQIVTPPTVEPVGLDVLRLHCRIDQFGDDPLLVSYLRTARMKAETYLGRALITQTLLWTVTPEDPLRPWWHFVRGAFEFPRSPVQSISSVTILDDRGNLTTIPPAVLPVVPPAQLIGYRSDIAHSPGRLLIGPDTVLVDGRTVRATPVENLQIEYVAGYGPDGTSVPEPIIEAILLTATMLYENRGDVPFEIPRAAEWLLDPYRMMFI